MSEWKGPWKCTLCGLDYPNATSNANKGKCQLHCGGKLIPYDRRAPDPRLAELEEALKGMVYQFAYSSGGKLHTGGLSALEDAFGILGWTDPYLLPTEMLCDEPGCKKRSTCGIPTSGGYRRVCGEHYAALADMEESHVE